jgi:hypothetical protein
MSTAVAAIIAAISWRAATKKSVAKYAPAHYDVTADDMRRPTRGLNTVLH